MPTLPGTATFYGGDFESNIYLRKGDPLPPVSSLVSPVSVASANSSKTGTISVDNTSGFMALSTGANQVTSGAPRLGLTLNSGSAGLVATVGDSSIAGTPTLQVAGQVAGVPTISQVNDPVYNPVTSLKSNVLVNSADASVSAIISVIGNSVPTYKGGLNLNCGPNASGPAQTIFTGRTTGATTMGLEIGSNSQTNILSIAGASGLSQVNDPVYNPATAQQFVNILGPFSDPDHPSGWLTDSPNPGTFPGSAGTADFSVSKTGLYFLQVTLYLPQGTSSDGAFSLNFTVAGAETPFTPVGGLTVASAVATQAPSDIPGYWSWGSYVPLTAGVQYDITVRSVDGATFGAGGQITVQLINIA